MNQFMYIGESGNGLAHGILYRGEIMRYGEGKWKLLYFDRSYDVWREHDLQHFCPVEEINLRGVEAKASGFAPPVQGVITNMNIKGEEDE